MRKTNRGMSFSILGMMLICTGLWSLPVLAATEPEKPVSTATITVGKTVTRTGETWPEASAYEFRLQPLEGLLDHGTIESAQVDDIPMPTGTTGTGSTRSYLTTVNGFTTLAEGDVQTITADLQMEYTQAGVYAYTLQEVIPEPAAEGVTYDQTLYYVVVYVVNVVDANGGTPTGKVTVKQITAWKSRPVLNLEETENGGVDADEDGSGKAGASTSRNPGSLDYPFVNTFATSDVTISKTVTGDLADETKHFRFLFMPVKGMEEGRSYKIEYQGVEEEDSTHSTTAWVMKKDGRFQGLELFLKQGERATIKDLPVGGIYWVSEMPEDYTPSYDLKDALVPSGSSLREIGKKSLELQTPEITLDDTDDQIDFSNNRLAPTLTGVVMNELPYVILMVLAFIALTAWLIWRKHKRDLLDRF